MVQTKVRNLNGKNLKVGDLNDHFSDKICIYIFIAKYFQELTSTSIRT